MDVSDLDRIEEELFIELPHAYREFMLAYPDRLRSTDAPSFELQDDPDKLIEINKLVETFQLSDWESSWFVIGESGCGDYYVIDVADDECAVVFWDHEQGRPSPEEGFDSLPEFAGDLVDMYRDLAARKVEESSPASTQNDSRPDLGKKRERGLQAIASVVRWYRETEYRLRGYRTIFPIPTDTFNAIIGDLAQDGWKKRYEYRGMDAWIDYGRIVLKHGDRRLVFEWDNWEEGSIEGKPEVLAELATRYDLEVAELWRWSRARSGQS